jgi:HSP20 family protein
MIVTPYNAWYVRTPAKHALNRFFNVADDGQAEAAAWSPRVDVREEPTRFVLLADLPGVDPAAIEIQMEKGVLSLRGERIAEPAAEGVDYTRVERRHGRFDRRFVLPDSADADAITARGSHGVVEISIPKKAEAAPRRIAING